MRSIYDSFPANFVFPALQQKPASVGIKPQHRANSRLFPELMTPFIQIGVSHMLFALLVVNAPHFPELKMTTATVLCAEYCQGSRDVLIATNKVELPRGFIRDQ